jgi:hypothetical protein
MAVEQCLFPMLMDNVKRTNYHFISILCIPQGQALPVAMVSEHISVSRADEIVQVDEHKTKGYRVPTSTCFSALCGHTREKHPSVLILILWQPYYFVCRVVANYSTQCYHNKRLLASSCALKTSFACNHTPSLPGQYTCVSDNHYMLFFSTCGRNAYGIHAKLHARCNRFLLPLSSKTQTYSKYLGSVPYSWTRT